MKTLCVMRTLVLLVLISCSNVVVTNAQWRRITPAEEAFVGSVEGKVKQLLLDAANKMDGTWETKTETDQFQRHELDEGQHKGRPHEVRIKLYMEYQPSEAEREVMEKAINTHAEKTARHDPIPDDLMRQSPEFKWNVFAMVVVNYYGFLPVSKNAAVALGYQTESPEALFGYVRWKQLGTGAPIHTLYFGDYTWKRERGEQLLAENFSTVTNCRDVKTIVCEVHSNEEAARKFISKLNLGAINELIRAQ